MEGHQNFSLRLKVSENDCNQDLSCVQSMTKVDSEVYQKVIADVVVPIRVESGLARVKRR
jgi:hypothetical protein